MVTPVELPDFLRGTLLLGAGPGGVVIPVLVDAAGNIDVLLRGADALGTVRTVRVDNVGQLYAILRGAGGNDVAVDAAGNLAAVLKGIDGLGALHTVFVDNAGQVIMVPRGNTGNYMAVDALGRLAAVLYAWGTDAALHVVSVDAGGQVIMVPRGNTGNYMAVDASGFLTAVLKGEYSGALHTISVDASGRIEAFALDAEDQWGKTLKTGNAELAARLGAVNKYDWRGQTVFSNNFEHGAHAIMKTLSGTGALIEITSQYWLTGGHALWMEGGSDASGTASFYAGVGPSPSGVFGLAICFSIVNKPDYILIQLMHENAAYQRWGQVRLDYDNEKIQVYDGSTSAWVDYADFKSYVTPYIWNNLKLVIDATNTLYKRVLYNDVSVAVAACPLKTAISGGTPRLYYVVTIYSHGTLTDAMCLDSVTLTVNEPA